MEEGAATVNENPTAPVAVPEAAVDVDNRAEGSTAPTAVPEGAVDADQHAESVMVPEEAVGVEQRAEGSTVPTAAAEGAVGDQQRAEDSTVPMVVPEEAVVGDQRAEGSTVPMVVTEGAVGVEQRAEGSTVPMVVPEEAVVGDQPAEGSTVPMVVTEEAVGAEQHAEGSTVPAEEAVVGDQRAEGSAVPMVVTEEAVAAEKHAVSSTVPMVVTQEAVDTDRHVEGVAPAPMGPEAAADMDHHIEDATTQDGDTDGTINVTPEEMRGIIEVIADTGKFWHEWSFLKRLLSLQLMQVLGEYSQAQMVIRVDGQQKNSLSAEKHSELFSQLNGALMRFEEGPPFTLQRLCEILLDPKGTYKKLSKLAFALEKALLVTSTITKCTDPYPAAAHGPNPDGTAMAENAGPAAAEPEKLPEHTAAVVSNGTEHAGGGDGDEEMADAEAEEAVPGSSSSSSSHDDVEMQEEKPDRMADVSPGTSSGITVAGETTVLVSASGGECPGPQS